jgi:predicted O-methyltransferase YrrM
LTRSRWRRLRLGLGTVTGVSPGGFFIPFRHAAACRPMDYPSVEERLRAAEHHFRDVLREIDEHGAALAALNGPAPEPRLDQDWFPRLDAAAAYAMVRHLRPRRILEVGSGHSTRFMARALRDGGIDAELTCIDPSPRASLSGLAVRHVPVLVQDAGDEPFSALADGDILFVDSSHVAMPGTDVDLLLNRHLPRLAEGVVIHVHDVFLPDPYPASWTWRGYNEQLMVAALLCGRSVEPLFASRYVVTRMGGDLGASAVQKLPLVAGAFESSLWLRKIAR